MKGREYFVRSSFEFLAGNFRDLFGDFDVETFLGVDTLCQMTRVERGITVPTAVPP